ncbi:Uncharacterized protein Fot_10815 [Forsythia ovata]|uniref:Uncharacterized protein n=1 Tax=Forsythia ovata TaxID=205694 RepID=A0ABD1WHW6_9LAMI
MSSNRVLYEQQTETFETYLQSRKQVKYLFDSDLDGLRLVSQQSKLGNNGIVQFLERTISFANDIDELTGFQEGDGRTSRFTRIRLPVCRREAKKREAEQPFL